MSYQNPMTKDPSQGYTALEMLDIWERNTNELTQMIHPYVLRGWVDTVVKANFILAHTMLDSAEAGKLLKW